MSFLVLGHLKRAYFAIYMIMASWLFRWKKGPFLLPGLICVFAVWLEGKRRMFLSFLLCLSPVLTGLKHQACQSHCCEEYVSGFSVSDVPAKDAQPCNHTHLLSACGLWPKLFPSLSSFSFCPSSVFMYMFFWVSWPFLVGLKSSHQAWSYQWG